MQEHTLRTFGQNMKRLRNEKRIIQQQLADALNTSRSCISNYESDTRQPDCETMKRIAEQLNVSVDYLLGVSPVKAPIKDISELNELRNLAASMSDVVYLDMEEASAVVRCKVAEFYSYLLQKEIK